MRINHCNQSITLLLSGKGIRVLLKCITSASRLIQLCPRKHSDLGNQNSLSKYFLTALPTPYQTSVCPLSTQNSNNASFLPWFCNKLLYFIHVLLFTLYFSRNCCLLHCGSVLCLKEMSLKSNTCRLKEYVYKILLPKWFPIFSSNEKCVFLKYDSVVNRTACCFSQAVQHQPLSGLQCCHSSLQRPRLESSVAILFPQWIFTSKVLCSLLCLLSKRL